METVCGRSLPARAGVIVLLLPSGAVSAIIGEPQPATTPGRPATAAAVSLAHVTKEFRLPHEQYHTLKERVLHPFRTRSFDVLKAVDDVSLDIARGEFFGIVGRNGSGKSTLLKCLAGIYDTTSGSLQVEGRLPRSSSSGSASIPI